MLKDLADAESSVLLLLVVVVVLVLKFHAEPSVNIETFCNAVMSIAKGNCHCLGFISPVSSFL
jgi:hypothetical protein